MSIDRREDFGTPRHRFTSGEYLGMVAAGVLDGVRCELIDGEVLDMSPISGPHQFLLRRLQRAVEAAIPESAGFVFTQGTVDCSEGFAPSPDLYVIAPREDEMIARAGELLLVVEVCLSSLNSDRAKKLPKYAAAGVREVWLLDGEAGQVECHTQPSGERYTVRRIAGAREAIAPEALPTCLIDLSVVFRTTGNT